jgi:PAS domain S-box-containing protein
MRFLVFSGASGNAAATGPLERRFPDAEVMSELLGERTPKRAAVLQPDIIVLDPRETGVDGTAVCVRLRAEPATVEIPVILVVPHGCPPPLRARALEAGADALIEEPVDAGELSALAAATLCRREGRSRGLVEQAEEGFLVHDLEGRIRDTNRHACEALGYTREELLGLGMADIQEPFRKEGARSAWERVRSGHPTTRLDRFVRKDGTRFPVEVRLGRLDLGRESLLLALFRDLREREQAEKSLGESERAFSAIFRSSPVANILTSMPEGAVIDVNDVFLRDMGYRREEVVGRTVRELGLFPERDHLAGVVADLKEHGQVYGRELCFRTKEGQVLTCLLSVVEVSIAGRQCRLSSVLDISGRKRHEEALRESEARFRALVEQAGEGFELFDRDGRFVAVNEESCRQTGYTQEELLRMTIFELAPRLTPERFRADWEARRNAGITTLETVHRRKDGTLFPVEVKVSILLIGDEERTLSLVHDITERRRIEELARKAAEQYRILTENVKDVVWILDVETLRYLYVSPAIERLLGYSAEEAMKMSLGQPFPPDASERLEASVRTRAADFVEGGEKAGTFYTDELLQPHRDGTLFWTEVVSGYYRNSENGHIELRGVTRDVTERHQAHEEIRSLNESLEERVAERTSQLEAANRELESFSYSVSHDLRAPLRAIDGFSKRVEDLAGAALDAECRRMLGIVRQNAVRMGKLIDDLLSFSRTSRAEVLKTAVPMAGLVRAVFAEVVQDLPAKERFVLELTDLPAAWGDATLLRQVWTNLLANAVKFSAPSDSPRVEVTGATKGSETVYSVRDNGVGFDMAYASKLFGVFQRLHGVREFEGTGIGLALVHRIVARHGGRIWADGSVGNGATFSFSLPGPSRGDVLVRTGSYPALRRSGPTRAD